MAWACGRPLVVLKAFPPQLTNHRIDSWTNQNVSYKDVIAFQSETGSQLSNNTTSVLSTEEVYLKTLMKDEKPVALFYKCFYKARLSFGIHRSSILPVVSTLNTRAIPNSTDRLILKSSWRRCTRCSADLCLKSAYNQPISIKATTNLVVDLGDLCNRVSYEVADNVVINILLRTTYIYQLLPEYFYQSHRLYRSTLD